MALPRMDLRNRGQHPREREGFTLIELLVVIAILALLASLLIPSFAGGKERAMDMACRSNLRQLATAAMSYETDHRGLMPRPLAEDAPFDTVWSEALDEYAGMSRQGDWREDGRTKRVNLYACPVQKKFATTMNTYAQNGTLKKGTTGQMTRTIALRSGIDDPGRWPVSAATIPYFLDGFYRPSAVYPFSGYRWILNNRGMSPLSESGKGSHPHDGKCNIVFLDGHVGSERVGEGIFSYLWNPQRAHYVTQDNEGGRYAF